MGDTKRGRERKGKVKDHQRRMHYEVERELEAADEPPETDEPDELDLSFDD